MEGSAILCTRGAMAAGAGMIRLGSPGDPSDAPGPPRPCVCTCRRRGGPAPFLEATAKCKAIVLGPGLGTGGGRGGGDPGRASPRVPAAAGHRRRRAHPRWRRGSGTHTMLDQAETRPSILTPHDGEGPRMAGSTPGRPAWARARRLAEATGAVVLLKGPLTTVAVASAAVTFRFWRPEVTGREAVLVGYDRQSASAFCQRYRLVARISIHGRKRRAQPTDRTLHPERIARRRLADDRRPVPPSSSPPTPHGQRHPHASPPEPAFSRSSAFTHVVTATSWLDFGLIRLVERRSPSQG